MVRKYACGFVMFLIFLYFFLRFELSHFYSSNIICIDSLYFVDVSPLRVVDGSF